MEANPDICILCPDGPQPILEDSHTAKQEALKKIRSISRHIKCDGKFRLLPASLTEKNFHQRCYKAYTSSHQIEAYKKIQDEAEKKTTSTRQTRASVKVNEDKNSVISQPSVSACASEQVPESDNSEVDFQKMCIFCYSDASENYNKMEKKNKKKPNLAYSFMKKETSDAILDTIDNLAAVDVDKIIDWLEKNNFSDLVHGLARYHKNCMNTFYCLTKKQSITKVDEVVEFILSYVDDHLDEKIMCVKEILSTFKLEEGVTLPGMKYLRRKLEAVLPDGIYIATNRKSQTILWRRDIGAELSFQSLNRSNNNDESERELISVAKRIREDIDSKLKNFENDKYPSPPQFFSQADQYIPESLNKLLEIVILHNKKKGSNLEQWVQRKNIIGNMILCAVHPKIFMSPLQMGISLTLYHRFGSRDLIEILSNFAE